MSSLTTLARPYAKAAFELARRDDALPAWDDMLALAAAMAGDEQISALLDHPHVPPSRIVELMSESAGDRFTSGFTAYLNVLGSNRRLPLLGEISTLYGALRQEAENRLSVRVVSAVALDDDQVVRMKAALARRFDKQIDITNEVDPDVLGGAIIYAGDQVIDGSLRGRLAMLGNSLAA